MRGLKALAGWDECEVETCAVRLIRSLLPSALDTMAQDAANLMGAQ
jgi:hypothetical protein